MSCCTVGPQADVIQDMTKAMGLQDMYDDMGGKCCQCGSPGQILFADGDVTAKKAEEAAIPLTDFLEKVDMSMTGKLWAPSESIIQS